MIRVRLGARRWSLARFSAPVLAASLSCIVPALAAQPAATAAPLALLDAPDRYMTTRAVRIRYREVGQGTPVLLLHGYTDRVEMWAAMADSLARSHRVIVPDLRGFGKSSKFAQPSDYGHRMVDDVLALMDHLGVDAAHVVGYSMGAVIAANVALRAPRRVHSAALVAGPFWPDSAALATWIAPHLRELQRGNGLTSFFTEIMPTWPDSVIVPVAKELETLNDGPSLIASIAALPALVPDSARIAALRVPALAIVGRDDRALVPGTERIARWWPNVRKVVLPRGDHADIAMLPEVIAEVRRLLQP